MRKLIWNNISRRRNQSLLTIAITTITILSFVIVLGVYWTMNTGLKTSSERLGADVIVISKDASTDGYDLLYTAKPDNTYMDVSIMEDVAKLEGVKAMSPQFFSQTLSGGCCDFGQEMRIVGYDPETDFVVSSEINMMEEGEMSDDDLVLGGHFTDFVGKTTRVLGKPFHVRGELHPTGSGIDDTVFMTIDRARQITAESEELGSVLDGKDPNKLISVIMIKLDDDVDPARFAKDFEYYSGIDAQCIATSSTVSYLQSQLDATIKVMLGMWLALLIVAVLSLIGRFNALAKDRKKEIGLLRALGLQKRDVFKLIIGEACTMALAGGVVGSLLACLLINPVMKALTETFKLAPSVWNLSAVLISIVAGILLAVVLGFIAAVRPASKSASLEPQTAITQGEVN